MKKGRKAAASKTAATKTTATKAAAVSAPKPKPKPAPRYPVEKLREHSKSLFGISRFAFDGAFSGKEGTFTVDEAKKIIHAFMVHRVVSAPDA